MPSGQQHGKDRMEGGGRGKLDNLSINTRYRMIIVESITKKKNAKEYAEVRVRRRFLPKLLFKTYFLSLISTTVITV